MKCIVKNTVKYIFVKYAVKCLICLLLVVVVNLHADSSRAQQFQSSSNSQSQSQIKSSINRDAQSVQKLPEQPDANSSATATGFGGIWKTTYGPMLLSQTGDEVHGSYLFPGGEATVAGQVKDGRFDFRYNEDGVEGAGWFELSESGLQLNGRWRKDGAEQWEPWNGNRQVPRAGRTWLIILESDWETGIGDRQYSFAAMLEQYFAMATARNIDVRSRTFHDEADLRRIVRQIKYLAEPVVLLISSHGTAEGILASGATIEAEVIADSLAGTENLKLLHLSSCSMMSGDFATRLHTHLEQSGQRLFPVSGYKTIVAWDASAIGDFTYLSMLLIRGLDPEQAVKQSILVSPYLGERPVEGASFDSLGLSITLPPEPKSTWR